MDPREERRNELAERRRQVRLRYARARFNYYDKAVRSTAHSLRWMDRNGITKNKKEYQRHLEEFSAERDSFARLLNDLEAAALIAA